MPEILEEYDSIIKQQLEEGIIEPVPERPTGKRITYISHQPVVREEVATTKVRVVYDASAKATKGVKVTKRLFAYWTITDTSVIYSYAEIQNVQNCLVG